MTMSTPIMVFAPTCFNYLCLHKLNQPLLNTHFKVELLSPHSIKLHNDKLSFSNIRIYTVPK